MNCLNNELNTRTIFFVRLLLFNEIYCIDLLSLHINTLYDNDCFKVQ